VTARRELYASKNFTEAIRNTECSSGTRLRADRTDLVVDTVANTGYSHRIDTSLNHPELPSSPLPLSICSLWPVLSNSPFVLVVETTIMSKGAMVERYLGPFSRREMMGGTATN